tara:strand:+ start:230 stop:661 length:432 start_codon:yes stop_codon:yes gene_type:complete
MSSKSYIKNCPILNYQTAYKDLEHHDFDFTEIFYKEFQEFMFQNPGYTSKELCEMITFYDFTEQSIDVAFKLFNTYKSTYHNICGPFIFKNDRWFPVYSKKYVDTIKLAQENSRLKLELKKLSEKINNTYTPHVYKLKSQTGF